MFPPPPPPLVPVGNPVGRPLFDDVVGVDSCDEGVELGVDGGADGVLGVVVGVDGGGLDALDTGGAPISLTVLNFSAGLPLR